MLRMKGLIQSYYIYDSVVFKHARKMKDKLDKEQELNKSMKRSSLGSSESSLIPKNASLITDDSEILDAPAGVAIN